jgi:hypothetical protein
MASGVLSAEELPSFPQTSLLKLSRFLSIFPPPPSATSTPAQLSNVLLAIHPSLSYVNKASWRSLEGALEGAGLDEYSHDISDVDPTTVASEGEGIWGWRLESIARSGKRTASVVFTRDAIEKVEVEVAAGPKPFATFPLKSTPGFLLTPRFEHLLCSLFQLHALGEWDISVLPPSSSLQSSSSSTTVLISTFAKLLGYELETVHLVKDLGGGRELWMRRIVETGFGDVENKGKTSWELAPMTKAALEGKLVHFEGIDTLGSTVGSLGRLLNDREGELWEGKRIVGKLAQEDVCLSFSSTWAASN